MKYLGTLTLALLVTVAMGQNGNNLTGPAAKNYKAYKDTNLKGSQINLASTSAKYEEGAKAKNNHVVAQATEVTVVPRVNAKRAKGANAKNRRFVKASKATIATPSKVNDKVQKTENNENIIQRR